MSGKTKVETHETPQGQNFVTNHIIVCTIIMLNCFLCSIKLGRSLSLSTCGYNVHETHDGMIVHYHYSW